MRICKGCGEEISIKRLAAMPSAEMCVGCQEKKDEGKPRVPRPIAYVPRHAAVAVASWHGMTGMDTLNDAHEKQRDRSCE